MLGRAPAAQARMREDETFRPVEATFVSSGRTAYSQSESVAETNGLVGLAIDLQDELMSLGRFGIQKRGQKRGQSSFSADQAEKAF
ncbi:hypothetical protein K4L06_06055 [Lysobacter sp. BMK333-48F3]|uniref:hypothetical protein n=1 Tax=Lysobacter sp. BMK333-48F3 TaxID=2867962 RepID=UPI001C8BEFA3|nr:hypothetical protein [Lysobacter sp. BMK333-48F3]MBX9400869.1 hypothetical protein [Lysobacter sp. BMK333-48F3]